MNLIHRKYARGQTVHQMVIARDNMHEMSDGNIRLWYFSYPDKLLVFWMHARDKGTGQLLPIIREMERRSQKPVWIADPIFDRMIKFCERNAIPICSPMPEISMRRPKKPKPEKIGPYCGMALPDECADWIEWYTEAMMAAPDTSDGQKFELRFDDHAKALARAAEPFMPHHRPPNAAVGASKSFFLP